MIQILRKLKKPLCSYISGVPYDWLHKHYKGTGVSFGKVTALGEQYNVAFKLDRHMLCIGSPGAGKSSGIVIPTLYSWDEAIFAIDIKSELSNEYENICRINPNARKFIRFNPMADDCFKYDVYGLIRKSDKQQFVPLIQEIVFSLLPNEDGTDAFWIESARSYLTAALIYYCKKKYSFAKSIKEILSINPKDLIVNIQESKNTTAKQFINSMLNLKKDTLSSITTGLYNKLTVFSTDPYISRVFDVKPKDKSVFDWNSLEEYNVFFSIPEHCISQWKNVIALMVNQLLRTCERRHEKHSTEGKEQKQILMLLDESSRLGYLNIQSALTTLRSKKVTICLFFQSLSQIDLIYGEKSREIIVDACVYKIFIDSHDPQTQRFMADVVGQREVEQITHTTVLGTYSNRTVHKHMDYIISPNQFSSLGEFVIVTPEQTFTVENYPYYIKHYDQEEL